MSSCPGGAREIHDFLCHGLSGGLLQQRITGFDCGAMAQSAMARPKRHPPERENREGSSPKERTNQAGGRRTSSWAVLERLSGQAGAGLRNRQRRDPEPDAVLGVEGPRQPHTAAKTRAVCTDLSGRASRARQLNEHACRQEPQSGSPSRCSPPGVTDAGTATSSIRERCSFVQCGQEGSSVGRRSPDGRGRA